MAGQEEARCVCVLGDSTGVTAFDASPHHGRVSQGDAGGGLISVPTATCLSGAPTPS